MSQEETILVCEIFKIYFNNENRLFLEKTGSNVLYYTSLPENIFGGLPLQSIAFSQKPQLLESVITSRLSIPKTPIFEYLSECYGRAIQELHSTINQTPELKRVAQESKDLIINYLSLAFANPEMFENCDFSVNSKLFLKVDTSKNELMSKIKRYVQLTQRFRDPFFTKSLFESFENFDQLFNGIIFLFRMEYSTLTVFNPDATDVLDAFTSCFDMPLLKQKLIGEIKRTFPNGGDYERNHVLGFILALGLLPQNKDPKILEYQNAVYVKIKACRTQNVYLKTCENLLEVYRKYKIGIVNLFKMLMRDTLDGVSCSEIIVDFFRRILNSNEKRGTIGFMIGNQDDKTCCSNSFALLFEDVLLELAYPIATRADLMDKVNLSLVSLLPLDLPDSKMNFYGIPTKPLANGETLKSTARFFFYSLEGTGKLFLPCFKFAERLYRMLSQISAEKKKLSKNNFLYNAMKHQKKIIKTIFTCYRLSFEDTDRVKKLNEIYKALYERVINTDLWIPEQFLNDYAELHSFYANVIQNYFKIFSVDQLPIYLRMLQAILSDKYEHSLPHIRAKFTEVMLTFNILKKGELVSLVREKLSPDQLENLIVQLLRQFGSAESHDTGSDGGRAKYAFRFYVAKFIIKALELPDYQRLFAKIQNSPQLNSFLGILLTDLNFFLDNVFENIQKLANPAPRNRITPESNGNPEDFMSGDLSQENPQMYTEMAKTYLKTGRAYLKMLDVISQYSPQICIGEAWVKKMATILNYYTHKFSSKNYKKIKFNGIEELKLKPLDFIRTLVSIYVRLSSSKRFQEEVISDDRSYSREDLVDVGTTAFNRNLVSTDVLDKFEKFINDLDSIKNERDNWNKIIANPPDEFLCALTSDLMTDPVMLPSSHSIVDRKSISEHLTINGNYDPYNRTKLTPNDLIPQVQLKEKIDVWLNERKKMFLAQTPKESLTIKKGLKDEHDDLYGKNEKSEKKGEDGIMDPFKKI